MSSDQRSLEQSEQIKSILKTNDIDSLRVKIAAVDEQIAFYEVEIQQSDAELDEFEAEAEEANDKYDFYFLCNPIFFICFEWWLLN